MKDRALLWLRISYWVGAVLDLFAALVMLFPPLFVLVNRPFTFQAGWEYRYAMGMGAPLMIGWSALLVWADRKPYERKDLLLITLLVVFGEVALEIWGVRSGLLPFSAALPMFAVQTLLTVLFVYSYLIATRKR